MINIHIEAHPDRGDLRAQVEAAGAAIGLFPHPMQRMSIGWSNELGSSSFTDNVILDTSQTASEAGGLPAASETVSAAGGASGAPRAVSEAPQRERGKPGPGRKRRSAEEVAEDETADAADAARKAQDHAAETPQISTGGERVDPQDTPEVQAQDAADEAAESAATKTGLTRDDVRNAVGRYQKRFGLPEAIKAVPLILGKTIQELTESEFAGAIEKIDFATENAPDQPAAAAAPADAFDGEVLPPAAPPKTKQDVLAAMMAYARKYDGPNADQAKRETVMKTLEDAPKVFALVCGPAVTKLSDVPEDKYGAVVAGLEEALAKNPFGR